MKRSHLPALSIFAAVARRTSFRGAAQELGISVSAVSHAINGLEAGLGLRLLARTTRSVAPTATGQRLLARLEPALAAIDDAVEQAGAAEARLSGTIRLSLPRSAAELVLLPILTEFGRRHPDVVLELDIQDGFVDIVAEQFDAGVRFGERIDRDMVAVRLGPDYRHAIVAAPAYFEARARPSEPRHLNDHVCIGRRFADGSINRWHLKRAGEAVEVSVDARVLLNDDRLIVDAAVAGAGVACVFDALVVDHLASGRLIRVLDEWCPQFAGFFLYYPSRQLMRPALRAFVDFIKHG